MASKKAVLDAIRNSSYGTQWATVWGAPIRTNTQTQIDLNYDRVGLSIAAWEASKEVNQFTSKFDAYLQGKASLTAQESLGMQLFDGKGECYDCHTIDAQNGVPPLFTDFSYENIGVPKNPLNPIYWTNPNFVDMGLFEFLSTSTNIDWKSKAESNRGKFKTPTLRNVAKMKRFMHNGVFTSLEQVVHFYNTRDVKGAGWNGQPWGTPEVDFNLINHAKVGNLKLTAQEEAAIVAFMRTLSDGFIK
jgi:cytochrome c peroxidase